MGGRLVRTKAAEGGDHQRGCLIRGNPEPPPAAPAVPPDPLAGQVKVEGLDFPCPCLFKEQRGPIIVFLLYFSSAFLLSRRGLNYSSIEGKVDLRGAGVVRIIGEVDGEAALIAGVCHRYLPLKIVAVISHGLAQHCLDLVLGIPKVTPRMDTP
jgi:hypothetical protein